MTYKKWERLHFKLLGYWPRGVVERRLGELHHQETERRLEALRRRHDPRYRS